ncbi:MAG TPA: hypothetical protein PLF88_06610, partial [Opitutaceae bacterium]|nr:hypothetical protein [Opitutaceae bacterium]
MQPTYFILGAIVLSLALAQLNQRLGSPVVAILERWLRWLIFGFGAAHLCLDFGLIDRPYGALVIVFLLLWLLGETLYNWLGIQALSVSPLPLFPRYTPNPGGEEWPTQPRLLRIREWLRAQGFKPVQALKAEIGGGIYLRVSVYQDAAATTRIQVTFLPQARGMDRRVPQKRRQETKQHRAVSQQQHHVRVVGTGPVEPRQPRRAQHPDQGQGMQHRDQPEHHRHHHAHDKTSPAMRWHVRARSDRGHDPGGHA